MRWIFIENYDSTGDTYIDLDNLYKVEVISNQTLRLYPIKGDYEVVLDTNNNRSILGLPPKSQHGEPLIVGGHVALPVTPSVSQASQKRRGRSPGPSKH